MHNLALALASLLTLTSAFVPFPQTDPPHLTAHQTTSSSSSPSLAESTPTPTLPPTDLMNELKKRQGAQVTAIPAGAAAAPEQVPPVTTYQIMSFPAGGGAPLQIDVPYTQLFVAIPDQWPGPSAGTIGLGTIQGQVGVVRTKPAQQKRDEMTATGVQGMPTNNAVVRRDSNGGARLGMGREGVMGLVGIGVVALLL